MSGCGRMIGRSHSVPLCFPIRMGGRALQRSAPQHALAVWLRAQASTHHSQLDHSFQILTPPKVKRYPRSENWRTPLRLPVPRNTPTTYLHIPPATLALPCRVAFLRIPRSWSFGKQSSFKKITWITTSSTDTEKHTKWPPHQPTAAAMSPSTTLSSSSSSTSTAT